MQKKYKDIKFDKDNFMKLLKDDISNNNPVNNAEKRKELVEEYKILQSKFDLFGTTIIRVRAMVIALFTASLLLMNNFNLKIEIIYTLFILVSIYFLYFEYITKEARETFKDRIFLIESALKSELFLNKIKVFDIGRISSKIRLKINFFTDKLFYVRITIIAILFFSLYSKNYSSNDIKKPYLIYNHNYNYNYNYENMNILEEIRKNNKLLKNNNEYLNDLNIYCSENKIEK